MYPEYYNLLSMVSYGPNPEEYQAFVNLQSEPDVHIEGKKKSGGMSGYERKDMQRAGKPVNESRTFKAG